MNCKNKRNLNPYMQNIPICLVPGPTRATGPTGPIGPTGPVGIGSGVTGPTL